jgi:hypothetical protein
VRNGGGYRVRGREEYMKRERGGEREIRGGRERANKSRRELRGGRQRRQRGEVESECGECGREREEDIEGG